MSSTSAGRPRGPRDAARGRTPAGPNSASQLEQKLNQLVAEVRLLEAYYQEVEIREQTASAALADTRSAQEAIGALSSSSESDVLVPIGGGVLLPAKAPPARKLIVNVGANVALEKSPDSAKVFLQNRQAELEKAVTALEQQRRELAARLDAGRAAIQQMAQQQQ
jgi:prefoldin alpha subunit